jgi:hypothetical protein
MFVADISDRGEVYTKRYPSKDEARIDLGRRVQDGAAVSSVRDTLSGAIVLSSLDIMSSSSENMNDLAGVGSRALWEELDAFGDGVSMQGI